MSPTTLIDRSTILSEVGLAVLARKPLVSYLLSGNVPM